MKKIFKILAPENVFIEYELAGLGSRFAAFFIDVLIQLGIILIVFLAMLIGSVDFKNFQKTDFWVIGIGIILFFIIFYGYFVIFEMLMNGQSPGKKVLKLRVIKQNGEPLAFFDSLLRNILRIADFLPALNLAGALFIIFSDKYKRLGDYAADTVIIKVREEITPEVFDGLVSNYEVKEDEDKAINIYPVNNFEYGVLKEFLLRQGRLGKREPVFIYHLNNYFKKKFALENNETEAIKFFQEIIKMNSGV